MAAKRPKNRPASPRGQRQNRAGCFRTQAQKRGDAKRRSR